MAKTKVHKHRAPILSKPYVIRLEVQHANAIKVQMKQGQLQFAKDVKPQRVF